MLLSAMLQHVCRELRSRRRALAAVADVAIRALLCGSRHFNDLKRGVPRISPTLLSKRLKEMQQAGIVICTEGAGGSTEYQLTQAGEDLRGLVMAMGFWGVQWVDTQKTLQKLDASLLM